MRRQSLLPLSLLTIGMLLLAACEEPTAPPSPTAILTQAVATTAASVTPTALAATATAGPAPATTTGAGPISDHPNDASQARLRVSQCVMDAPPMDVYLNGKVPVDAGFQLPSLGALDVSRYEYLTPGTYTLVVAPNGQNPAHPLLGPLNVTVVAGHRYTVVILGQKDEANHKGLVIDETAAYQAIGAKPTDHAHLTVNNIKGVPGIDFAVAGQVRERNVAYGGFGAGLFPVGYVKGLTMTISGSPDKVLDATTDEIDAGPSGADFFDCQSGTYPGFATSHSSMATSSLSPGDFLQLLTDEVRQGAKYPAFHTFVSALKTTGLADQLAGGGPYLVFAPSDEAFASLPKDRRDALLADPGALAEVVRYHILDGYYPPFTMSRPTAVNLRGDKLVITGSEQFSVNGEPVAGGGDTVMLANGTRLIWTSKVLLPPTAQSRPQDVPNSTTAVLQFTGHTDGLVQASFSPDGQRVATASRDDTARIWDAATGAELLRLTGHSEAVGGAVFSPDGKTLLTTSPDATARLWDAATGQELRTLKASAGLNKGAFSPDGKYIVATADDGADVWEVATGKSILTFTGHSPAHPNRLAFTPDGKAVVTGGTDGTVLLWEPLSGKVLMTFTGHTAVVGTPALSPDGKYLVTGSNDNTARLWELGSGRELRRIETPGAQVQSAAFSPDGQFVATSGSDGLARLWDARLEKELRRFTGHTDEVRSVVFSPDGKYILTASLDGTARLWPVK